MTRRSIRWPLVLELAVPAVAVVIVLLALPGNRRSSPRRAAGGGPAAADLVRSAKPVAVAQSTYHFESLGTKVHAQTRRIAADAVLLNALSRGDLGAAQAEADFQLRRRLNHHAHVTRISVIDGSRVLVNATVNNNGSFVVAPVSAELQAGGRRLGTLLVSIQDVIGFIKLVRKFTHAQVVVRGSSGQVRASLPAATHVQLPDAGYATVAGRTYFVRSFGETGWGGDRLKIWLLERVVRAGSARTPGGVTSTSPR